MVHLFLSLYPRCFQDYLMGEDVNKDEKGKDIIRSG